MGLAGIYVLTIFEASPFVANLMGYAIALIIAFLSNKRFVFRSEGSFSSEMVLYLGSFATCYTINLGVLYVCVSWYSIPLFISQGIAVFSYAISMYLASRLFVFSKQRYFVK